MIPGNHGTGRSMSLLEAGDKFRFNGLVKERPTSPDDEDYRIMTVFGISVSGDVTFRIDMPNEVLEDWQIKRREENGPSLHSVRYDVLMTLIGERIWEEIQLDEVAATDET